MFHLPIEYKNSENIPYKQIVDKNVIFFSPFEASVSSQNSFLSVFLVLHSYFLHVNKSFLLFPENIYDFNKKMSTYLRHRTNAPRSLCDHGAGFCRLVRMQHAKFLRHAFYVRWLVLPFCNLRLILMKSEPFRPFMMHYPAYRFETPAGSYCSATHFRCVIFPTMRVPRVAE